MAAGGAMSSTSMWFIVANDEYGALLDHLTTRRNEEWGDNTELATHIEMGISRIVGESAFRVVGTCRFRVEGWVREFIDKGYADAITVKRDPVLDAGSLLYGVVQRGWAKVGASDDDAEAAMREWQLATGGAS